MYRSRAREKSRNSAADWEESGEKCPGWESNPHEEKSPEDFKSSASAIPPPGHRHYKSNEYIDLLQYRRLHRRPLKHPGVGCGVGWSLGWGIQPLHGCPRVLRSEATVSHIHCNGLATEKLLHGTNVHPGHGKT